MPACMPIRLRVCMSLGMNSHISAHMFAAAGSDLPSGWVAQWSAEYNRYYYENAAQGKSVWEKQECA